MRLAWASIILLLSATAAAAQTPAQVIVDALQGNANGSFGVGALGGGLLGGDAAVVMAVLRQQATTLPLGTSSGGFTWEFDRALGVVVRRSRSFGAIFADRALTVGRGRLSVGVTSQHTAWRSLAGRSLPDGELAASDLTLDDFYTDALQPVLERYGTTLNLRTDRTTVNVTYGVTERLDLNVTMPFGRTTVTGGVDYSYTIVPTGQVMRRVRGSSSATASGLGDLNVRGKYSLWSRRGAAVAVAADLRFPTGSEDKLLGAGRVQTKTLAIVSGTIGKYSPRLEVGYLFGGAGLGFDQRFRFASLTSAAPSDEMTYTAGVDAAVSPRLTIAVDILGRTLRDSASIRRGFSQSPQGSFTREVTYFYAEPGSVSLLLGTAGAKVAIGSAWLLTGSVLFPINDAGLKAGISPVVGVERSF